MNGLAATGAVELKGKGLMRTGKPGGAVRGIVLDTVTDECGLPVCAEGSVDDPQFQWLDEQLTAADELGEYALVFSHHTLRTTRMLSSDVTEYARFW